MYVCGDAIQLRLSIYKVLELIVVFLGLRRMMNMLLKVVKWWIY